MNTVLYTSAELQELSDKFKQNAKHMTTGLHIGRLFFLSMVCLRKTLFIYLLSVSVQSRTMPTNSQYGNAYAVVHLKAVRFIKQQHSISDTRITELFAGPRG